MGLSNEDLEVGGSNWGLPNMVVLVEDHHHGFVSRAMDAARQVYSSRLFCAAHVCVLK